MEVSRLALGTYELRSASLHQAEQILNTALEGGVNYIDTAPCYGQSEELIGKILHARRDQFLLASKCGCVLDGNPFTHQTDFTAGHILKNLENSLRLLKTDYLDVWLLHGPAPADIPGWKDGPLVQAMVQAKQKGLVRQIGISCKNGGPAEELFPDGFTAVTLQEALPLHVFDLYQTVYGALSRQAEHAITHAAQKGAAIISRGALRAYTPDYAGIFKEARLEELMEPKETMQDFLLRFALTHPDITAVLVGTQNPQHLLSNIQATQKGPLPSDLYQEAIWRLDRVRRTPLNFA